MMKKIVFLLPYHWSAGMGGSEFQVKCLLELLVKNKNYKIYFLAKKLDRKYNPNQYELIEIAKKTRIDKYGYFLNSFSLLKRLKDINPHIVYQRVGCAYTGIAAYYAKHYGAKLMWHIASDADVKREKISQIWKPHQFVEKKIFEYGIKYADVIISQTDNQKYLLENNYGRLVDYVIRNFHPIPDKIEIKKYNEPINILWIANFKKVKQPEIFLNLAMDIYKLVGRKAEFTMIGKPANWNMEWQNTIEKKINNIPNLKYIGSLSHDEVNLKLSRAHILVNTSKEEGFPNTFIQAWMRNVPVVSLNCDPDGLIMKNEIGILAGDYHNLVNSIAVLVNRKDKIKYMGEKARVYAQKHHSLENAKKLIEIMGKI